MATVRNVDMGRVHDRQIKPADRSVPSNGRKSRQRNPAGLCFGGGRTMIEYPRRYTQKKAADRSVSPDVRNKPFRRVSDC